MDNWEAETLNISGIVDDSIVDGRGFAIPFLCKDVRMDVRNATIRRHTVLKRTNV